MTTNTEQNYAEENKWRIFICKNNYMLIAKSENPCGFAGWVHTEFSYTIIRQRTGKGIEGMANEGPTESCMLSARSKNVSIPVAAIVYVIHTVNMKKWEKHLSEKE